MSFHREKHTFTVSGGTGTFKTDLSQRGLLWHIFVRPATVTTTWEMEVIDRLGDEVLGWDDMEGSVQSTFGLEVPFNGFYDFNFTNVSADELFTVRFTVREPVYAS